MKKFIFKRVQLVPITLEEAWQFFSDPRNLSKITPASLDFQIETDVPKHIENDLTIEYTVKPLLNIPVKWVSRIKDVYKPYRFADEQIKGPYAYWHHEHLLSECHGGTRVEDIVTYALPFGLIGEMIHPYVVLPKLNEIFEYRRETLEVFFGKL